MLLAVVLSVLQWSLIVAAIWFSALAAGEAVGLVAATAIFVLIVLGLSLPNSPMQVGTTQLAFTVGFSAGGHSAAPAIAASVVYTLFLILPVMIAGGIYLLALRRGKVGLPSGEA